MALMSIDGIDIFESVWSRFNILRPQCRFGGCRSTGNALRMEGLVVPASGGITGGNRVVLGVFSGITGFTAD